MRKAFRRKAWQYSVLGGVAISTVVVFATAGSRLLSVPSELAAQNRKTLSAIVCREYTEAKETPVGTTCDNSLVLEDDAFEPADYVLDRQTGYFIFNSSRWPKLSLNVSDVTFLRRFREPTSVLLEPGTVARLYSAASKINSRPVEIMVSAIEASPAELGRLTVNSELDDELKAEAESIARQLGKEHVKTKATEWQIVDANTNRVIAWSGDVPAFHPLSLIVATRALHFETGELWLVQSDTTDRLLAVSLGSLGNPYALLFLWLAILVGGAMAIYPLAKKIVTTGLAGPIVLDDALKTSETEYVEFKQEVKERDSLLKDVAAFANTRGGTVFVGVMDGTLEIIGIDCTTPEKQDAMDRGLRDSIRQRIQPPPEVSVDFPRTGERVVARIFVRASAERHSFDGRYYVREGTQSRFLVDGEIDKL
jgi:Putative DNA-binding domain